MRSGHGNEATVPLATSHELLALSAALSSFRAPPEWRVLWTDRRLDAHWASEGSWARYSIRFHRRGEFDTSDEVFFCTDSGRGRLTVTFTSSDLLPETMAAAADMLSPMHQLLASASLAVDRSG